MKIHDVSVEEARQAIEMYGNDLSADDLIEMAIHRWEPR
jgi:hypothetical protein